MNVQRGDVLKARFPHASGERGKKRPVVVVQADVYNHRLRHAVGRSVCSPLRNKLRFSTTMPAESAMASKRCRLR